MERPILLFSQCFEAPDNLLVFIKSLGYDTFTYNKNFDLMFDERVIKFVKENLITFRKDNIFRGKENYHFKIGFAGCATITKVDTSRPWVISFGEFDEPKIKYIEIIKNEYGFVSISSLNN